MKLTNQEDDIATSFFRLRRSSFCGARLASSFPKAMADKCEIDREHKAKATADKLYSSSSSTSCAWSSGVLEYRSDGIEKPVFCGLGLELFARPVINNETVLPKAAVTAGKIILRLNLGVASAALRDARQRNLWKGEW